MSKFKLGFVSLIAAFTVASCIDPNQPSYTVSVKAPDWANHIDARVSKRSAYVTAANGEEIKIYSGGTDIGNGLTARRTKRNLYISDKNGVECNWGTSDELRGCKIRNPAYDKYMAAKKFTADSLKALKK